MLINYRRKFIKQMGLATAGTLAFPAFLHAQNPATSEGKRLIVIQLSGGNDGLNTIIPYRNESLLKGRPALMKGQKWHKVTDEMAFNAGMSGFRSMYDQGDISIINSVGYPNPNRSHFRSMDIWQSASGSSEYLSSGWLGRFLDNECSGDEKVKSLEMNNVLSLALKGNKYKGLPITNIPQFYQTTKQVDEGQPIKNANDASLFLYKTIADTRSSAAYLFEQFKKFKSKMTYPQNAFGNQLKQVAELILSGMDCPIYYVSLSGFDTHNNQQPRQQRLLNIYSEGLKVFGDELKAAGEWDHTLVLTFSEFGRRVNENASGGTDHGKANNVFLAGGKLASSGLFNPLADLSQMDSGDVKYQIDFRSIYSSILRDWLHADATKIITGNFDRLNLI